MGRCPLERTLSRVVLQWFFVTHMYVLLFEGHLRVDLCSERAHSSVRLAFDMHVLIPTSTPVPFKQFFMARHAEDV